MEVTPIRSASEHVASCWEDVLGTMPEATLAVRREAFCQLLLGRAPMIDEVAKATGLSMDTARRAVKLVVSVGMAETIDSTIVGMDGLTTRRTRHRLTLDGVEMWTWCAYDIVGIAAALGADAVGEIQCGICERPADVVIKQGEPEKSPLIGWIPDESCSNVMAEFCASALLFCSQEHLGEWRARDTTGSGTALDLSALAQRGRSFWQPLAP
jgi:alkylmercury lyase